MRKEILVNSRVARLLSSNTLCGVNAAALIGLRAMDFWTTNLILHTPGLIEAQPSTANTIHTVGFGEWVLQESLYVGTGIALAALGRVGARELRKSNFPLRARSIDITTLGGFICANAYFVPYVVNNLMLLSKFHAL